MELLRGWAIVLREREVRGVVQHQKRRWTVRTVVVVNAAAVVLVALIMVNAPPVPINAVLVLLEAEKYTVRQLWSKDYVEADQ